jgi:hypothetical protein
MLEELVEDLVAELDPRSADDTAQESVIRKFFGEGERADFDLALDVLKAFAGAPQISFRRRAPDGWPVSDSFEHEVELNSSARRRDNAASEPFAAHAEFLPDSAAWILQS